MALTDHAVSGSTSRRWPLFRAVTERTEHTAITEELSPDFWSFWWREGEFWGLLPETHAAGGLVGGDLPPMLA